jgi:hypothetical protein
VQIADSATTDVSDARRAAPLIAIMREQVRYNAGGAPCHGPRDLEKIIDMKSLVIAFGLTFVLGCGKKGIEAKLDELGKIRDAMCQCQDKACAEKQHDAFIAWKMSPKDEAKPDKDQMARYESIHKEMMDCRHKYDAPGGDTGAAPAAPAPAAPAPAAPATP